MEQVAIVTGGASGIGLALGAALVQRGWHVVLADLQDVAAKEHADRLTTLGPGSAVGVHVDVRDADAVAGLVGSTHAERGRLDLMVSKTSINLDPVEPEELELVHWDRIIDVNLRGVIHGCQAAYPLMLRQGHGQILNVASARGCDPQRGAAGPLRGHQVRGGRATAMHCVPRELTAGSGSLCCVLGSSTPRSWTRRGPRTCPNHPRSPRRAPRRESVAELGVPLYPADRLAEDTIRGLERNKAVLVIPSGAHRCWC